MTPDDGAAAPFFMGSTAQRWQTTRYAVDLTQPRVMGIVNVTPDSFAGGDADRASAIARCEALLAQGADILDVGGESTRPGAAPVPWEEEWRRVHPVLAAAVSLGCPVSVDTMKPQVMQRALDLGVDIVNDVNALRAEGALSLVAAAHCGVCLMHMHGQPRSMQRDPIGVDVVGEACRFLAGRADALRCLGADAARIVLDPGIGFGKTVEGNFALLRRQGELLALGYPLLVGWSSKSSLGAVTGRPVGERQAASIAAALAAVQRGARIVRVHDVAATIDALRVWKAAGLPDSRDDPAAASPTIRHRPWTP